MRDAGNEADFEGDALREAGPVNGLTTLKAKAYVFEGQQIFELGFDASRFSRRGPGDAWRFIHH